MFWWHSPFELSVQLTEDLLAAGGRVWTFEVEREFDSPEPLILIYLPPHAALLPPTQWLEAYRELLSMLPIAEAWHVERLDAFEPINCYRRAASKAESFHPQRSVPANNPISGENLQPFALEQPSPLIAVVTLTLLREYPGILDCYLDLELAGNLAGTSPDANYVQRLREASSAEALILSLLNDRTKQRLVEAKKTVISLEASLEAQNQETIILRQRISELQDESTNNLDLEKKSREQLRQSCEQLEEYFLANQNGRSLIEAQGEQLQRASLLLQRMALLRGIGIGKLPRASIQLLALLEGYRHSLKRAERLIAGIRDGGS
jgi:hypothetical protein